MLPAYIPNQLPQAKRLWDKLKQDLAQGFRVLGHYPDYMDVIRVWTLNPESNYQFLIIARARQDLKTFGGRD